MLTLEEKSILARKYEPVLFHHRDERYDPYSPTLYLAQAALWANKPVGRSRERWGDGTHTQESGFPRDPLVPKGFLSHHDIVGKTFIGDEDADGFRIYQVSDTERELFFQGPHSWGEGGPDRHGPALNFSAENFQSNLEAATSNLIDRTYYVDVHDQDTIDTIPRSGENFLPPNFGKLLLSQYPHGYWLLSFRILYTYHEERITACEIDSEVVRAKRANSPLANHLHGSYEGDWQCVAILVPNPGRQIEGTVDVVPSSPLELSDEDFPEPAFVGFSRRARGVLVHVANNLVDSASFTFVDANSVEAGEVRFRGLHPFVYVALGTHNFYASQGSNAAPRFDSSLPLPIEIVDPCILADNIDYVLDEVEEVRETVGKVTSVGLATGVSAAKIIGSTGIGAAGGALGAGLGALVGLGQAAFELLDNYINRDRNNVGDDEPDPSGPSEVNDNGPPNSEGEVVFGWVVSPSEIFDDIQSEFQSTSRRVGKWNLNIADHVIQRGVQHWWEPDGEYLTGYRGLWGARVELDPFNRRSGTKIPAFEEFFLADVIEKL